MTVITREALQLALARCMAAHPAQGPELTLYQDADEMATLYAEMVWYQQTHITSSAVPVSIVEAYTRWAIS